MARGFVIMLFVGFIGASMVGSYLIQTNIEHATINVVSKERLLNVSTDSEGKTSSKWENFVYTDEETYKVADSFWNWHFRARTVYAKIKEGSTCDVTLSGYRWGFLSAHQNIIEAECK